MVARFIFIFVTLFPLCNLIGQDLCYFDSYFYRTEIYPRDLGLLTESSSLQIIDDTVILDLDTTHIISKRVTTFNNKMELLHEFACLFEFQEVNKLATSELLTIRLQDKIKNRIDEFQILTINDCQELSYYFICSQGVYVFQNNDRYFGITAPLLYNPDVFNEKVARIDTTTALNIIRPLISETVTEQVLLKDAYNILEVSAPVFSDSQIFLHSELSTCPEAIIDTQDVTYFYKETYDSIYIIDAEFRTVTEEVLLHEAVDGPSYYLREPFDAFDFSDITDPAFIIDSISSDCTDSYFFDCLHFSSGLEDFALDTLQDIYPACADGYQSAGAYCYSQGPESPAVYERRYYEKLESPAKVEIISTDPIIKSFPTTFIRNRNELDPACIISLTDTLKVKVLDQRTFVETIEIDPVYGLRQYNKIFEPAEIVKEGSGEDSLIFLAHLEGLYLNRITIENKLETLASCTRNNIISKLLTLGYLDDDSNISNEEFYRAVIAFQIDEDISIGIIGLTFMEKIGLR